MNNRSTDSASSTAQRVRDALTGPVASLRTPFNRDGSIDYAGLRRVIDFNIAAGSRTSLLTAGDSHLICMSDEEIAAVNRVVVEHTAGRALTVACDWEYATPQAVSFARHCRDLGADIIMVRPPDWANSGTTELLVAHYAAVAEVMPVMLVTNIFAQRSASFGLETMVATGERVVNLLAVKEDLQNEFARMTALRMHRRCAVFAGGGLRNHLNMLPYGCDGFMDRHMNFAPRITQQYWQAVQASDLAAAMRMIEQIELPLEEHLARYPGGRDAAIHGLLELAGICGRWRRPPYHSLSDSELAQLKAFARDLEVL